MQSHVSDALKAMLFQGDTIGVSLPRELVEDIEFYDDLLRHSTSDTLRVDDIAKFVAMAFANHRGEAPFDVGAEFVIRGREQKVWFKRPGPWGFGMFVNEKNEKMPVHYSRVQPAVDAIVADDAVEEVVARRRGRPRKIQLEQQPV